MMCQIAQIEKAERPVSEFALSAYETKFIPTVHQYVKANLCAWFKAGA